MNNNSIRTLRVTGYEIRVSETVKAKMNNEGRYAVVTYQTTPAIRAINELGEEHIMKVPVRQTSQTAWIDSPIPGREVSDYGAGLVVGDQVPGDIVTREVEPYFIISSNGDTMHKGKMGRWVSTASVVVFGMSNNNEDWDVAIKRSFKQRNFMLKNGGDAAAPGGSLASAMNRPQTKVEGHDPSVNMPKELQSADAATQTEYTDASSVHNQAEGDQPNVR